MIKQIHSRIASFLRHQKLRYLPYSKIPYIWFKNRNIHYKIVPLSECSSYKKSDTIFVLGSGPSVTSLTMEQWQQVKEHDSFGINFSFLLDFVPTFHSMEDGKSNWLRGFVEERMKHINGDYSDTVSFISDRHMARYIHPRLTPEFFPHTSTCCVYKFPIPIVIEDADIPFSDEAVDKHSIIYRGSLSTVLYLIDQLGYKKIVLLGVDLHTPEHFFYSMPEMKEYVDRQKAVLDKNKFESMLPKARKMKPFDEYLYFLKDYLHRKKGVELLIGFKDNMLYPKIPSYFE